jgi:DNA replication protein DnaC
MENLCENIQETYQIKNGIKVYDFKKCLLFLEFQGKSWYGGHFKIIEEDLEIIYKLLIYVMRDEINAKKIEINLDKGILLSGPVGCGKTSLMSLINLFSKKGFEYKIKPAREIAFEFASQGYDSLNSYTQKFYSQKKLNTFCFDYLGTEQQIKHFGNDCNVMAEILISRYEQFVSNGSVTHITTNLSASEIGNLYGNRLRSRMRSMFNLIAFDRDSCDKR